MVTLGKTVGSASVGAAEKPAAMAATAAAAEAGITAAVAGELVGANPLTISAVAAAEAAVLHMPSPKLRTFVFGVTGRTLPATVSSFLVGR